MNKFTYYRDVDGDLYAFDNILEKAQRFSRRMGFKKGCLGFDWDLSHIVGRKEISSAKFVTEIFNAGGDKLMTHFIESAPEIVVD